MGFGYPLGLVWGEEGVFSPESMLWQFWVLSSGFRICSAGIVLAELVGLLISQQCLIRQLKQPAQSWLYTAALNDIQI
jgi:hypothetical protein